MHVYLRRCLTLRSPPSSRPWDKCGGQTRVVQDCSCHQIVGPCLKYFGRDVPCSWPCELVQEMSSVYHDVPRERLIWRVVTPRIDERSAYATESPCLRPPAVSTQHVWRHTCASDQHACVYRDPARCFQEAPATVRCTKGLSRHLCQLPEIGLIFEICEKQVVTLALLAWGA